MRVGSPGREDSASAQLFLSRRVPVGKSPPVSERSYQSSKRYDNLLVPRRVFNIHPSPYGTTQVRMEPESLQPAEGALRVFCSRARRAWPWRRTSGTTTTHTTTRRMRCVHAVVVDIVPLPDSDCVRVCQVGRQGIERLQLRGGGALVPVGSPSASASASITRTRASPREFRELCTGVTGGGLACCSTCSRAAAAWC